MRFLGFCLDAFKYLSHNMLLALLNYFIYSPQILIYVNKTILYEYFEVNNNVGRKIHCPDLGENFHSTIG